jgi:hypothetical protein
VVFKQVTPQAPGRLGIKILGGRLPGGAPALGMALQPPGPGVVAEAPESFRYVVETYLPFLVATIGYPLAGLIGVLLHSLLLARRGLPPLRPASTAYSVYVIAGLLPLLGGAPILFKAVLDYVYGATVRWRIIMDEGQLEMYLRIAWMHEYANLLAGFALGLLLFPLLARGSYESWYLDVLAYGGNLAWYLALAPIPLRDFNFSYRFRLQAGLPPGFKPFQLVAGRLEAALLTGLAAGAAVALAVYALSKGAPRPGRTRVVWLPPPPPSQPRA